MRLDLLEDEDLPVEFGRYRVLRVLGEGGMARVFEAELGGAEGFRKRVALKVVRGAETRRDPALRRALVREARLGGLLRHPGIVDTYDFGEHDGQVYIAMELVRGAGLDELLRERGAMPAEVLVAVAIRVAEALDAAHTATDEGQPLQLVHRDLKPSNILVAFDGTVKVADFGIAKAATIAGDTRTGETKGTPLYMSPEQLEGGELDGRSDLFALGAMLWEMALGERLQRAESLPALVLATLRVDERLDEPGALTPLERVVPGFGAIVAGCLRRNRDERYADAAALLADLKTLRARLPAPDVRGWVGEPGERSLQSAPTPRRVEPPLLDTVDTPPPPEVRSGMIGSPPEASPRPVGGPIDTTPDEVGATRLQRSRPRRRSLVVPALVFAVAGLLLLVGVLAIRGASVEVSEVSPSEAKRGLRLEVAPVDDVPEVIPELPVDTPTPAPPPRLSEKARDRSADVRPPVASPAVVAAPEAPSAAEVTPEPGPVAEATPPPPSPLAITFADYERIRGPGQKIRLRFIAETRCPDGCDLTLGTRDARGDQRSTPMTGEPPTADVVYPPSSAGHIKWWVTARDPEGNVARYGSEKRPEDAPVR